MNQRTRCSADPLATWPSAQYGTDWSQCEGVAPTYVNPAGVVPVTETALSTALSRRAPRNAAGSPSSAGPTVSICAIAIVP